MDGGHTPESKVVTVLVTGFGPFQQEWPVNPSFEIARSLPEYLSSAPEESVKIRIIGYGSPIRVSYDDVRELVPVLHDSYNGSVDIVLHIGMASGRKYYAIERYAHRDGYDRNNDLDKRKLPPDDGQKWYPDCPAKMATSLQFEDVFKRWQSNVNEAPREAFSQQQNQNGNQITDVRMSYDAGHYLCDFIYFNSLAYFARRSGEIEGGRSPGRPVLFLHVPPESNEDAIMRGRAVTTALVQAMADSWAADVRGD
ncbi:peptidase C15, pyroglutamyl peptidase I-like protein [Polychaeton citri CBS 116435]|uniref:Peptidase C15, pyroglutamyl peptidase I-like protein n=1 Tax=Polychaeton citri CBS 116435 TaxID=1314669 RepID=A0A9P4QGE5_9PEZI|nr:peptidase C15, pyroglutamyl peptidase I-like protein [Polychaeton citri CBS 116435]